MYKCMVVTDPETAPGFQMAGVEVIELADPDDAGKLVSRLLHRDDTGVIAMNEEFIERLDRKIMERIEKSYRPIIIPIPSGKKQADQESYIDRLLRRAIGYNIVVRR
ncbi:MAG: V-type ATP synthase subunit F [Methanocalculus sp. MSAO_Arc1]|uniref:V-type ATP synthase subunit F n=1 Tax=Methanocalculus TaxID=71151 RepID=UPI000FF7D0D1|nr:MULTISPECIES: V-type ATP synthase subunit F [unclassified Methanocalculus]MCP1662360.1 V/A-type H+-transporting ATPase subunit F [Methanocalculus sp. AMF5]RQD81540.1 MAG: V-type ATP synthase subunit F [Methanocalculus sp. MSAO_Arc1]